MDPISADAARAARDLRVLLGRLVRRLRDVYDTSTLTPSQLSVLSRLGTSGPASASDLATAEGVRPQSVATILTALDAQGLVDRTPDPHDGRRLLISLTAAGRERADGVRVVREEWLARAFQDRFTAAERATVRDALTLLDRLTLERPAP
ncbi:MarR family winged helix-turn-helix transcriptional regulator [Cellulomonas sp.]|uniref:MarR family winged helix-turn-helix transcriptional regulator n=1 Tax=Cellulomonas sp. TaxID=40001 RepID=UPI003BAB06C2